MRKSKGRRPRRRKPGELTPLERQQRLRARLDSGINIVRQGILPLTSDVCPWVGACKSKRCDRGRRCIKIPRLRRKLEAAYLALPGIEPEHTPLVRQAVQAQMLLCYIDGQIGQRGVTYTRPSDGKMGVVGLLAERRRWVKLLLELHEALGLSPRSAGRVKTREPMGLDEVLARAEVIEATADTDAADAADAADAPDAAGAARAPTVEGDDDGD